MAHARRQILDLVLAAVTDLTTTLGNVYEDPTIAIERDALPAIAVEAGDEPVEADVTQDAGWPEVRFFDVVVTGIGREPGERDRIAAEFEKAVAAANPIGQGGARVVNTTHARRVDESSPKFYAFSSTLRVTYAIYNTDPETLI
jgi:hypothetical protein